MYTAYFGFQEKPFNVTPDPRFFYSNPAYEEAYANLLYGIRERKGFIVLTGEVGTGKTTLLHRLMDEIGETVRFVFFYNSTLTFDELLGFICDELGLPVQEEKRLHKLQALNHFLIAQLQAGATTALLIDEAQNLSAEVLESLRLLSNLETASEKLLQIVLVGQPELETKLAQPALRQLQQRVALHCHLDRLKDQEVEPFIQRRLRAVGCERPDLFTAEAIQRISVYAKGTPRLINIICDNALLIAYGISQKTVSAEIVEEVASDLQLDPRVRAVRSAISLSKLTPPTTSETINTDVGTASVPPPAAVGMAAAGQEAAHPGAMTVPPQPPFPEQLPKTGRRDTLQSVKAFLQNKIRYLTWMGAVISLVILLYGTIAVFSTVQAREYLSALGGQLDSVADVVKHHLNLLQHSLHTWFTSAPSAEIEQEGGPIPSRVGPQVKLEPRDQVAEQAHQQPLPLTDQLDSSHSSGRETEEQPEASTPAIAEQSSPSARLPQERAAPHSSSEQEAIPRTDGAPARAHEGAGAAATPQKNELTARLAELSARAAQQLAAKQLTRPTGNNALETYQEMLQLDPQSQDARVGMKRIRDQYRRWAEAAMRKREWAQAQRYYANALTIDPHDQSLQTALEQSQQRLQEQLPGEVNLQQAKEARDGEEEARMTLAHLGLPYREATVVEHAEKGDARVVELFLKAGMSPNAKDITGWTALMMAAMKGHTAVVRALLDRGADVNAKNPAGGTALLMAAPSGHAAVLHLLLDHGADVNATNRDGWTALMCAAWHNYPAVVQALLARNAATSVKTVNGETALTLAASHGNTQVVHLLTQAGVRE
jgi:general secretion pathway protein A